MNAPAHKLDRRLDTLSLPARALHWAERRGVRTLAELIARDPRDVNAEWNVGQTTMKALRTAVRDELGVEWDSLWIRHQHEGGDHSDGWNTLAPTLPASALETPLARVPLRSARIREFIRVKGLSTLSDLLAIPDERLTQWPNIGVITVADTRDDIVSWLKRPLLDLDDPGAFWTIWRERLGRLSPREAATILQRSGLDGPTLTLEELGKRDGVSRERMRQLEERGLHTLRRDTWISEVHDRVLAALDGGVLPLSELDAKCPCLAPLNEDRHQPFAYFLTRIAESPLRVTKLRGQTLIVACALNQIRPSLRRAKAAVKALSLPADPDDVKRAIASAMPAEAPGLLRFLEGGIEPSIRQDERGRMLAYGKTRHAELLAFLHQCPEPVRARDVYTALGTGRYGSYPSEVFYFDHGLIGLEKHFPDFQRWKELLVAPSVRILKRDRRQWCVRDLFALISADYLLPEWFTHWHLAEILRRTPEVRSLGRLRVVLASSKAKRRARFSELARDFLETQGGPVTKTELQEHLRRHTTFSKASFDLLVLLRPLFRLDEHRIGLLDRDVPGGAEAMTAFGDALAAHLERRREGFTKEEFEVYGAEVAPADWTFHLTVSVARTDPRFRLARTGGLQVGLAEWESLRVPSRAALVRACVEEHGGKAPVREVMKRLHTRYSTPKSRAGLWRLVVVQCGMSFAQDCVVSEDRADADG